MIMNTNDSDCTTTSATTTVAVNQTVLISSCPGDTNLISADKNKPRG